MITDKKVETVEAQVDFLCDLDVTWISLVSHGANRLPFKIVKGEDSSKVKDGEVVMFDVVHSIIVPKGVGMDSLRDTNPWMNGIKFDHQEDFEEYVKYVQVPTDRFQEGTLRIRKLDDGVLVFVGKVDSPDPTWVVMHDPTVEQSDPPSGGGEYVAAFKEAIVNEVDSFMSVMIGALEQSALSAKKKKSVIANAMDAFRVFIMAGIDNGGSGMAMKVDMPQIIHSDGEVVMSKTEENIVEVSMSEQFIGKLDLLCAKIDEMVTKLEPRKDEAVVKTEEVKEDNDAVLKMEEKIVSLQDALDKLVEKMDAMDDVVPESVTKSEDPVEPASEKQDIWVGSIFRK